MKLTRADFKDALRDAKRDLELAVAHAACERETYGKPTEHIFNQCALENAKIAALKYYLKHHKEGK